MLEISEKGIRLYAGDIPTNSRYTGLIGLSLNQENDTHIPCDLTNPPLTLSMTIPSTSSSLKLFLNIFLIPRCLQYSMRFSEFLDRVLSLDYRCLIIIATCFISEVSTILMVILSSTLSEVGRSKSRGMSGFQHLEASVNLFLQAALKKMVMFIICIITWTENNLSLNR